MTTYCDFHRPFLGCPFRWDLTRIIDIYKFAFNLSHFSKTYKASGSSTGQGRSVFATRGIARSTLRISKTRERHPGPMKYPELLIGKDALSGWTQLAGRPGYIPDRARSGRSESCLDGSFWSWPNTGANAVVGGAENPFKLMGIAIRTFEFNFFIRANYEQLNRFFTFQAFEFVYGHCPTPWDFWKTPILISNAK